MANVLELQTLALDELNSTSTTIYPTIETIGSEISAGCCG